MNTHRPYPWTNKSPRKQDKQAGDKFYKCHGYANVSDAKSRFQQLFLAAGMGYTASDIRYETKPADGDTQAPPNCQWISFLHLPCSLRLCSHGCRSKKAAENQVASLALAMWDIKLKAALAYARQHEDDDSEEECEDQWGETGMEHQWTQEETADTSPKSPPICDTIDLSSREGRRKWFSPSSSSSQLFLLPSDDDNDSDATEDYDDNYSDEDDADMLHVPTLAGYAGHARMTAEEAEILQACRVFDEAKEQMEAALELVQGVIRRHRGLLQAQNGNGM